MPPSSMCVLSYMVCSIRSLWLNGSGPDFLWLLYQLGVTNWESDFLAPPMYMLGPSLYHGTVGQSVYCFYSKFWGRLKSVLRHTHASSLCSGHLLLQGLLSLAPCPFSLLMSSSHIVVSRLLPWSSYFTQSSFTTNPLCTNTTVWVLSGAYKSPNSLMYVLLTILKNVSHK